MPKPAPHDSLFFKQVLTLIEQSGLTQNMVGKRMGFSPAQISRRVNEETRWKPDEIVRFCEVLKLGQRQRDELLTLAGFGKLAQSAPPLLGGPHAEARAEYLRDLAARLRDHSIRGFEIQSGSRIASVPLSKIFLPLEAVEGRPAMAATARRICAARPRPRSTASWSSSAARACRSASWTGSATRPRSSSAGRT